MTIVNLKVKACKDLQFDSHLLARSFSNECFHFRHSSGVGLMGGNNTKCYYVQQDIFVSFTGHDPV